VDIDKFQDLPDKTLLRPRDVAAFLSVSLKTVYRWYRQGSITGIKVRGSLRIYRGSIVKLIGMKSWEE
jgi:excisionase family DNA binding protein